jgi:hypothetical protein
MANLPGVYTQYRERKPIVVATPENNTDEILLFGTATDGPVLTPVTINRPADALAIFGTYPVPSIGDPYLVPGVNEAYYAGGRRITCVRVSGLDASANLNNSAATPVKVGTLFGKYPGDKYNDVNYEITATELRIWNIADSLASKVETTKTYLFATYTTLGSLALAVNANSALSDVRMTVTTGQEATASTTLAVVAKTTLLGGDDELKPTLGTYPADIETQDGTGYRGMLAKAYRLFYEHDADMVVSLGVHVGMTEDATPTYDKEDATVLANFCFGAALRNNDIYGIIDVAPLNNDLYPGLAGVSDWANELAAVDNTYTDGEIDLGRYINIVVGEPIFNDNSIGSYANTSAACYAGLASRLPVQSGTTNKVIDNAVALRTNLSPTQTEYLKNNKFTVLRYRNGRGVVVTEGLLASLEGSDFNALSTVRIIHGIIKAIRSATDPFIGNPLDVPHVNSIDTAIRDVLKTFAASGAITTGTFQLFFGEGRVVGDIDVDLELEIPSELRRIMVTVSRKYPNFRPE